MLNFVLFHYWAVLRQCFKSTTTSNTPQSSFADHTGSCSITWTLSKMLLFREGAIADAHVTAWVQDLSWSLRHLVCFLPWSCLDWVGLFSDKDRVSVCLEKLNHRATPTGKQSPVQENRTWQMHSSPLPRMQKRRLHKTCSCSDRKIKSYLHMENKVQKKFSNEMSAAVLLQEWFAKLSKMLNAWNGHFLLQIKISAESSNHFGLGCWVPNI